MPRISNDLTKQHKRTLWEKENEPFVPQSVIDEENRRKLNAQLEGRLPKTKPKEDNETIMRKAA